MKEERLRCDRCQYWLPYDQVLAPQEYKQWGESALYELLCIGCIGELREDAELK